jgi:hypothetical protein
MDLLAFILMTCSYLYYDLFHIQYCNGSCGMLNKVSSIKHRDKWRALVRMVVNLRFRINAGTFLPSI